MTLLDITNINKSFGGLHVIHNLSFQVGKNEIVSVIGPNGAGKSTVLNLITGIYAPDTGDIHFQGQ